MLIRPEMEIRDALYLEKLGMNPWFFGSIWMVWKVSKLLNPSRRKVSSCWTMIDLIAPDMESENMDTSVWSSEWWCN